MATNATSIRSTRGQHRQPTALGFVRPGQAAVTSARGGALSTRVLHRGPGLVPRGSLGTALIQKPPSGVFYHAGEYCPLVDWAGRRRTAPAAR